MAKNVFETTFNSEIYKVKGIVCDILEFITKKLSLSPEDKGDLKLIFSELLFNAIIHGNSQDMSKNVYVYVEVSQQIIYSIITDEGIGFDYLNLLSKINEEPSLLGESGRGVRLVYSLTDSMAYNITGNEIKFYKRVTTDG